MAIKTYISCDACARRYDCDDGLDIPTGVAMIRLWDDRGCIVDRHVCTDDHRCFTKLVRLCQKPAEG